MSKTTPYVFYVETKLPTEIFSIRVAGGNFSDNPTPEEKLLHALYSSSNPIIHTVQLSPNTNGKIKVEVFFVK